jgi:hypothetical protein
MLAPVDAAASPVGWLNEKIATIIGKTLPKVAKDIRPKVFQMARRLKSIAERDCVEFDETLLYAIADEWERRAREVGVIAEPGDVRDLLAKGFGKVQFPYDTTFRGCVEAHMERPISPIAARFRDWPAMQRAWIVIETAAACNSGGVFPLSGKTLGDLIGVTQQMAASYLRRFRALGLIEETKKYEFKKAARCYRLVEQVAKLVQRVLTWAETVMGRVWKMRGTLRKLVTGTTGASEADTQNYPTAATTETKRRRAKKPRPRKPIPLEEYVHMVDMGLDVSRYKIEKQKWRAMSSELPPLPF